MVSRRQIVATKTKSLSLRDVYIIHRRGFRNTPCMTFGSRGEGDREKEDGDERGAREDGRKRRKYLRDRYKYGAIYDSLMYS